MQSQGLETPLDLSETVPEWKRPLNDVLIAHNIIWEKNKPMFDLSHRREIAVHPSKQPIQGVR